MSVHENAETFGKIFVVDDTPVNISMLDEFLVEEGFKVLVATSGESALSKIEAAQPDLCLLDVVMPGLDGFETCERLKRNPATRDIPVIFMTALANTQDKVRGFEVGAVDYITKPFDHREVLARVYTHLNLSRLQKQAREMNEALEQRVAERTARLEQEIAERRQAEGRAQAAHALFQAALDSLSSHILILDGQGRIRMRNHAWAHIAGRHGLPLDQDEIGVNYPGPEGLSTLPDAAIKEQARAGIKALLRETQHAFHLEYACPGTEETRWFSLRANHFPYDDGLHTVVVHEDITDRVHAEEIQQSQQQTLAREVAEKTAELRRANAELSRNARMKDVFLANMSHELRTPLNGVLSATEVLQEQIFGPLNEKQLKSLGLIESSSRHLLALINDILDLAKIEANKMALEIGQVLVDEVCQASMRMVRELAHKKRLRLCYQLDDEVESLEGDERRLKQILVNLLSNAVKFTPEKGSVGLEVRGESERGQAHFTVWDTGIGIPEEEQGYLFKAFVQVNSGLNRSHEGTGLGLSLVYRLAEMHGGSVKLKSKPGEGSHFTISLPWQPKHPSPEEGEGVNGVIEKEPAFLAPPGQNIVLLAEDNPTSVEVLADYLNAKGFKVHVAANGQEAIGLAHDIRPNIILMDIQMPVMDGLEATRHLRADPELKSVPVIALTALAMSGDRERCLQAGVNEYMSKPIRLKELLQTIQLLLGTDS